MLHLIAKAAKMCADKKVAMHPSNIAYQSLNDSAP
jgi:hypothetical protein